MRFLAHKLALIAIATIIGIIDQLFFYRKSGWLFHGYNGRPIGNNFALINYVAKQDLHIGNLMWVGGVKPTELPSNVEFRNTPERHAPIAQHMAFIFFLMKFRVISVEGAGDLSFYLRFLPRRGRLVCLLPHGLSLKGSGVLAPNLTKQQKQIWNNMGKRFDVISSASLIESYMLSATHNCPVENVPVIGCQRPIASKPFTSQERHEARLLIKSLYGPCEDDEKIVIYAPTHRDHLENTELPIPFGFPDYETLNRELNSAKCRLYIRSHAIANNNETFEFSHICDTSKKPNVDFYKLAPATDILVTDYSGIFIEFLKSDMNIAFWQYDMNSYRHARGISLPEGIFEVGKQIEHADDFKALITADEKDEQILHAKRLWSNALNANTQLEALEKTVQEVYNRLGV